MLTTPQKPVLEAKMTNGCDDLKSTLDSLRLGARLRASLSPPISTRRHRSRDGQLDSSSITQACQLIVDYGFSNRLPLFAVDGQPLSLAELAERRAKAAAERRRALAAAPAHWDPVGPSLKHNTLVLLSRNNPMHAAELTQVHERWTGTGGAGSIIAVHRVQNLTLWRAYETMKAKLLNSGALVQSDVVVYHGTRGNAPELIHAGSVGFDPRKGVRMAGHCWFAEHASYSSQYGHVVPPSSVPLDGSAEACSVTRPYKQIFQARITLTAGQNTGQGVFMIPHAARAYPQYLITFQETALASA